MSTTVTVTLHPKVVQRLNGARLTKKALRSLLDDDPGMDFINEATLFYPGAYVSGRDAVRNDLVLEVHDHRQRSVALVNFGTIGPEQRLRALVH